MAPDELAESRAARKLRLKALLDSDDWQDLVQPVLAEWMRRIERRVLMGREDTLDLVRFFQGQHDVLRHLVDRPLEALNSERWEN